MLGDDKMFQYLTLQYSFKANKDELVLLKHLTHTAKNVYNNSVYLIKNEYLSTGRLPVYKNIEAKLLNNDFKSLHITTAYELYSRAFNAFKLILKENRYNDKKKSLPGFLPKNAYTTIVIKDVKFNQDKLIMMVPINKGELLKGKIDEDLKKFIASLDNDYLTLAMPSFFKDKSKRPIHLKIHPSKDGRLYTFSILYAIDKPKLKVDNGRVLAMDLGVNNLASCVDTGYNAFIIDGRYLKSILHLYNKRIANLQKKLPLSEKGRPVGTSKLIERMFKNRKNKITDYLNRSVAEIINYAIANNITTIVIGWNKGLTNAGVKSSIESTQRLISRLNQSFMGIPFEQLREKIKTRCMLNGIRYEEINESYTSAKSFYDNDDLNNPYERPSGKRIARGLYEAADGKIINADINAAFNILRKYLNSVKRGFEAPNRIITPYRVYIYRNNNI